MDTDMERTDGKFRGTCTCLHTRVPQSDTGGGETHRCTGQERIRRTESQIHRH